MVLDLPRIDGPNIMSIGQKTALIFGASGMLGSEIYAEARRRGLRVIGASRRGPDLRINILEETQVCEAIFDSGADMVINAAALVSHAKCENDPCLAYQINGVAVAIMANAARALGVKFIQISTDQYFSGDGDKKHTETAPVKLLNEYARSKYAGEAYALTNEDAIVIRTNVTGFRQDHSSTSFIEWVFEVLESSSTYNLFSDYYTSTMATRQAAEALFDIAEHNVTGIINVACREVSSKQTFVNAVARAVGVNTSQAVTVSVHDNLERRAESNGLDVGLAESLLGRRMPTLEEVIAQLVGEYQTKFERSSRRG